MPKKKKAGRDRRRRVALGPERYFVGSPVSASRANTNAVAHLRARCPAPKTHQRLAECHVFWHRAFEAYHDPAAFRRELNVLIQALRNVTFVLQSEKAQINDFDNWYAGWQNRMKTDPVMKWIVDARNRVVKQGDLETESQASVRLVYSYEDYEIEYTDAEFAADRETSLGAINGQPLTAPPSSTMNEQRRRLTLGLPARIIEHGFIEYTRRWVDSNLPDHEILAACAHAFAVLRELVEDLHTRDHLDPASDLDLGDHGGHVTDISVTKEPVCMAGAEHHLLRRRLKDGTVVVGGLRILDDGDEATWNESRERYGLDDLPPMAESSNVADKADWYMEMARRMLVRDGYHITVVVLFRGDRVVNAETLSMIDQADKIAMMSELARVVERSGVDGLIFVSESWLAPFLVDSDGFPIPARESADRSEALTLDAIDAYGNRKHLVLPFAHENGAVVPWDEPIILDTGRTVFLAPILAVWERARSTK